MVAISYLVNLLVLVPLLAVFLLAPDRMDGSFGPQTDARRILICLYATIAVISMIGLWLVGTGYPELAAQIGLTLFAAQVIYKLLTVPVVGLGSPVVVTNLVVVAVHLVTLWKLLRP